MVRLIDADSLLKRMQNDPLFDLVERYGVSGVINAEPTVDAIPVKWLEDRIRLYRDCENDLRANIVEREIELWRVKNR